MLNVRKEKIVCKRDLGQSPSFKDRGELLAILFEMEVIENPRPSRATNPAPEFRIIDQCRQSSGKSADIARWNQNAINAIAD